MAHPPARAASLAALAAVLAATALVPRVLTLDRAFTIDERLWLDRSAAFAGGVARGDFRATLQTGHPGVTTMWLGGFGQRTLHDGAGLRARYARARLFVAVASVVLILLAWWLARGLVGGLAAGLAGFLLALDPFLLAHNRVLHLDGLLALLMLTSFLAVVRGSRDGDDRFVVLSGALAGLALLTKQPAVFLVLAAAVALLSARAHLARRALLWAGPALAVFVLAWPAMWVAPGAAIAEMLGGGGRAVVETPSDAFFLGRQVVDPGPLFYPVALLWRTSVVTSIGAVAAVVWALRRWRRDERARTALVVLAFAAGFLLMMTIGPKKGDRYGLPAFAALDVAVAIALAAALARRTAVRLGAVAVALLALHGGPAIALHPYELAHFNWAVGGPLSARHVLVVGWGEGLDEAATDLARLPRAERTTVAVTRVTQFAEFFPGATVRMGRGDEADLMLFYLSSVQAGVFEREWRRYEGARPIYVLEINRLPYVRVYPRIAGPE